MASADASMPDACDSPYEPHLPSYPDPNASATAELPVETPAEAPVEAPAADPLDSEKSADAHYAKLKRKFHEHSTRAADLLEAHHTLSLISSKATARSNKAYNKRKTSGERVISVGEHMLELRATELYETSEFVRCLQIDAQTDAALAKQAQRAFARARAAKRIKLEADALPAEPAAPAAL